jgi:hypothetical protein
MRNTLIFLLLCMELLKNTGCQVDLSRNILMTFVSDAKWFSKILGFFHIFPSLVGFLAGFKGFGGCLYP